MIEIQQREIHVGGQARVLATREGAATSTDGARLHLRSTTSKGSS